MLCLLFRLNYLQSGRSISKLSIRSEKIWHAGLLLLLLLLVGAKQANRLSMSERKKEKLDLATRVTARFYQHGGMEQHRIKALVLLASEIISVRALGEEARRKTNLCSFVMKK